MYVEIIASQNSNFLGHSAQLSSWTQLSDMDLTHRCIFKCNFLKTVGPCMINMGSSAIRQQFFMYILFVILSLQVIQEQSKCIHVTVAWERRKVSDIVYYIASTNRKHNWR